MDPVADMGKWKRETDRRGIAWIETMMIAAAV
jgi:hypothetical protein